MNQPNELDLAELKVEMKNLYKRAGPLGAYQALYEIVLGANLLLEVIMEEQEHDLK